MPPAETPRTGATLEEIFPVLGLRLRQGPLELRGLTDEDLVQLAELATQGIHLPGEMPFAVPWTEVPTEDLARNTVQFHWANRAAFAPTGWDLQFGVWRDGVLVGSQGLATKNFLVTRTGETGSWLGRAFQGQGIGTAMRQAICAFAFDHLEAVELTSGAFVDNPASAAVSRKVGYRENGVRRMERRPGEVVEQQDFLLTPEWLVRSAYPLEVEGVAQFGTLIGL